MFNGIEAVLTNGQALTAVAAETDLGWFAAFAYPPSSPPQSVLASTTEGPIEFGVEDFAQPMEFTADGLG
jgi:hypothetical protein